MKLIILTAVSTLTAALLVSRLSAGVAPATKTLVSTGITATGEQISYPAGVAKVTMELIDMRPGEHTDWHTHEIPFAVYVLQGELTVAYQGHGVRVYRAGDAFLEAMHVVHQGRNTGSGDVRLLGVFIGANGLPLSTPEGR